MADTDTTITQIAALVEQARQEAFKSGWDAAIKSVVTAATNAAPEGFKVVADAPLSISTGKPRSTEVPQREGTRAPWGLVERALDIALDRAADRGVSPDEVRAVARELEGHDLAENSVRSACLKRERRDELIRNRGRWFKVNLAVSKEPAGSAYETDPAASDSLTEGGSNGTALASY